MNNKLWNTAFGYTSVFNSGCFCTVADRSMDSYISYIRFCVSFPQSCTADLIKSIKPNSSMIAPSDPGTMEIATKLCLNTGIDSCTKFSFFLERSSTPDYIWINSTHAAENFAMEWRVKTEPRFSCSENAPFKVISVFENMLLILANTLSRFLILTPEILINLYKQSFLLHGDDGLS